MDDIDNYIKEESQIDHFPGFRHYSRLVKDNYIAAVEIHKEVIIEKYRDEFNCKIITQDTQIINDFSVLSFENQLSLSIITSQINDYGFELKKFSLRNAYDIFLLSKKADTKRVISKFNKLKNPLNCFVANCNHIFGDLESLKYYKTKESKNYIKAFKNSFNKNKSNIKNKLKRIKINLNRRFDIICKSVFNRENRKWLFKRIKRKVCD